MFKGFCEKDTLIGPDLPWVEFVETAWYVSAYNLKEVQLASWLGLLGKL